MNVRQPPNSPMVPHSRSSTLPVHSPQLRRPRCPFHGAPNWHHITITFAQSIDIASGGLWRFPTSPTLRYCLTPLSGWGFSRPPLEFSELMLCLMENRSRREGRNGEERRLLKAITTVH